MEMTYRKGTRNSPQKNSTGFYTGRSYFTDPTDPEQHSTFYMLLPNLWDIYVFEVAFNMLAAFSR